MSFILHSFTKHKQRWFKIAINLIMIFIGLEFIELAYATETFGQTNGKGNIYVLYAMYLAFIAGLFPNYATMFADEIININKRNISEVLEIIVFFIITFFLNVGVIYLALKI